MEKLSREETLRYSRHFNLKAVGLDGQRRLKSSSVLLIGAGGLGSPLALYLAAAGVGRIGIVDFDVVDETNLQRQILHGSAMIGISKLESARQRLNDLNPHVHIELHPFRLDSGNALALFGQYDVVADGADNFATRYLVNDACVLAGKPLVSGSILSFEGQLSVYNYQGGPCYRCLFPEPPPAGSVPSCAEGGVLGVLPGVIGCLQAVEVLKILLGEGEVAAGRLLLYDALKLSFTSLNLNADPECAMCGPNASIRELQDYATFCGDNIVDPRPVTQIQPEELQADRAKYVLLDVRKPFEREICSIEPSHYILLDDLAEAEVPWPKEQPIVVYCKAGARSKKAALILQDRGFLNVSSLTGGVLAWSQKVDPTLFRY